MKKVLIPTIIAMMAIGSASAFAAEHTTGGNTQTASTAIEYAKRTLFNPDGSTAAVYETWADPVTHNERLDYLEPVKGTEAMQRIGGGYVLDNGKRYIKVGRDTEGNLMGSAITAKDSDKSMSDLLVTEKQEYINEYKEGTRREGWTDEGMVPTSDGKKLKKLSRTDHSKAFKTTYTESIFLDESGLPVQGEIYQEKNGTNSLLYTYVYEFKNVENDGSLFETKEISLQEVQ
ncbi:acid shock protein [Paenibacillus ehimensis]|uniref:acid shock protein n=1 Tax=Paenibacillus ehimensis TaxID=79264 RepID=UPI000FD8F836|nr:acid shock protein [Paenibacillus ehimensis]